MGYLGNQPTIGAYHKLDAISTVNGQATYNLLLDSVAFTPQSVNHMLVVVNGIVQSPTTNYTISGSTITFTGNLVTGDVINEIRVFGDVLNIGTPSDATVTNAKTNFVSTSSAAGLDIKGDGTTDGTLRLLCSQGTHGVKIASPAHSSGQSYTIKLPTENIAADKIMKVASITGSGTSAVGQMSFVDEPSSFAKLLETNTITNSDNTFYTQFNNLTTNYGSSYNALLIQIRDLRPENANRYFQSRVSASAGGLDNGGSDYAYTGYSVRADGNASQMASTGAGFIGFFGHALGDGSGSASCSLNIYVFGYNDSSLYANFVWHGGSDAGSATNTPVAVYGSGFRKTTAALQNIAFGFNSFADNPGIHQGIFKLYGLNV